MPFRRVSMNEVPRPLRSETLALDALIAKTLAQAEASADQGPADRMVFLGNRHQAFPSAIVKDPVLEPVDKLVWMVIMLAVGETGGNMAFPGHDAIGRLANVSSRSTIARAIAILRATRWLTLCARVRNARGRFHGNVYALHDEPLPLVDALHLDAGYMAFLGTSLNHAHARVRAVARGVLDSVDEDIQAGEDLGAQPHPIERRLQSGVATPGGKPRRFFSFTPSIVRRLRSDLTRFAKGGIHHDQNSNTVENRVQNLHAQNSTSSSCSSSYINKTTTTTLNGEPSNFDLTGKDRQPLVYPARLCDNHREIAARYLSALDPEQRQPVLDELEGRLRAEAKGMTPVYDAISFLHSLCERMRHGKFQPNLGITVDDERRERKASDSGVPALKVSQPSRQTDAQRQQRRAVIQTEIANMRKLLGRRAPTENQGLGDES
jgi:hypothetical protein